MFRRKLYMRAAVFPIPGPAVVIISQECMIDLNRERVDSARRRRSGWAERESKRVVGNFWRADVQRTAHAAPGEKRKGRTRSVERCAATALSGYEIYNGNWDTRCPRTQGAAEEYREESCGRKRRKIMESGYGCNNINGS